MKKSETAKTGKTQLNISPGDDILTLIDDLVARYGTRHITASSRNALVADCLRKYLPLYAQVLESSDRAIDSHYDQVLRAIEHAAKAKR